MLDINKIRQDKEKVKQALLKRIGEKDFDLDQIIELDDKRRELIQKSDELKAERNKYSKTKPSAEVIQKMKRVGDEIKKLDEEIKQVEEELKNRLSELPNIPADDVLPGGKENNKVIKVFKEKPQFNFKPKNHVELATSLDIIDYKRAAKISGAGFWIYKGEGALLEWALLNYFIDFHRKNGYIFLIPPFLLTEESAYVSGHLPKFRDDLYWILASSAMSRSSEKDKLCLNATAEMMLGNYHRGEILEESVLPLKYFAYSACFRREAGSYGREERGMIRGHQFNKIEMFQLTQPEDSWKAFDELVRNAEKLVEGLGLHYQTTQLAAEDTSAAMAKTVDIEVWIPSMEGYREVSSVSNALDYQARRGNVKFKDKDGKNKFVHTLNASGLATSRLLPAILEQFQQKDGSVIVPRALRKYCKIKEIKKK